MPVLSVKLSDEEWEALRETADRRGLYAHGVAKIGIRREIGLSPIPSPKVLPKEIAR